jgi:hypothetical protein
MSISSLSLWMPGSRSTFEDTGNGWTSVPSG